MPPHFSISIADKNHKESSRESFATSNRAKKQIIEKLVYFNWSSWIHNFKQKDLKRKFLEVQQANMFENNNSNILVFETSHASTIIFWRNSV